MSVPRPPRRWPKPAWKIDTISGWASYLGITRPTLYRAIAQHRFWIGEDVVLFWPARVGKPKRGE